MAFTPTSQLKSDPQIVLKDPQHAARLFVDDQFKFLPKSNFLFHVSFSVNQAALTDKSLFQKHRNEINMLVKSADLPAYTVSTESLNQYNRTKIVQYRHKYNDLSIKFHDDNFSVINKLWQNYYRHYYSDTITADTNRGFERTATKNANFIKGSYGYSGKVIPFFNHITIYQLARHDYVGYKLVNPIITSWNHNKVDYSSGDSHDFDMKLQYEAVSYSYGEIKDGVPEGFGVDHYDQTPSPLSSNGSSSTVKTSIPSNNNVTQQINLYQNSRTTGVTAPANTSTSTQNVSGIPGFSFPVATGISTTAAPLIKL